MMGLFVSRRAALGIAAGAFVGVALAACGGSKGTASGGKVNAGTLRTVRASLASERYVRNVEGKFFLLPATDNAVIAVSWKCTHMGCALPPPGPATGGNLVCPCHGASFDGKTGLRLGGPANRPLDYMHAVVENGNVIVDTGQAFTRAVFELGQTAPLA